MKKNTTAIFYTTLIHFNINIIMNNNKANIQLMRIKNILLEHKRQRLDSCLASV